MTDLIEFVSHSLGDNIAWSPYCYEYQKITGRKVVVKTKWAELFDDIEDKVRFYPCQSIEQSNEGKSHPNGLPKVLGLSPDGQFNVDWRSQITKSGMGDITDLKKINFYLNKKSNIQKQICDQLHIPYKQIVPTISIKDTEKYTVPKSKYVCISVQSTSKCKLWTESGWDKVVRFLKTKGYKVICIDRDESFGSPPNDMNLIPKKAINETGNFPIQKRIKQIMNCDFFIGLSSGLSWLAWALGKKVVMISGSTDKVNEFDCFRVQNESVCHGCLNDEDLSSSEGIRSNWAYCPRNKKLECRTKISFDMVKEQITKCMYE